MADNRSMEMAKLRSAEEGVFSPSIRLKKSYALRGICCWVMMGIILAFLIIMTGVYTDKKPASDLESVCSWSLMCEMNTNPTVLSHDYRDQTRVVFALHAAVAADNSRCSQVGLDILQQAGGNAVDAAIATAFCQGVVNPFASGIGGGFFMVVRTPDGEVAALNARECAPGAASQNMYSGMSANASLYGPLAIAVPMELKGLDMAWQRYGSLPWADLVLPAQRIAAYGYAAHPYLVQIIKEMYPLILNNTILRNIYLIKTGSTYRAPNVGERCCRHPLLAETLTNVVVSNITGTEFMNALAGSLAYELSAMGGIITDVDIINAAPRWDPITPVSMGNITMYFPPPPSSGAVVALAFQIMAGFPNITYLDYNLTQYLTMEAVKDAFAVRMNLGDPGTTAMPQANISAVMQATWNTSYVNALRANISMRMAQNASVYGGQFNLLTGEMTNDAGTSHISIVDKNGMAVALTSTINTGFGSLVTSPSTGILFNNQMNDFGRPDMPNVYGLAPTDANFIAPFKRPLSSMSPMIVTMGDDLHLVFGANGGPRIISAMVQAAVDDILLQLPWEDTIQWPRLHAQLTPNYVYYENYTLGAETFLVSNSTLAYLNSKGDVPMSLNTYVGNIQAVAFDHAAGFIIGISDPRKDGAPAGY